MKILLGVMLYFILSVAQADPWVISGQTSLSSGVSIDNPLPASSGAVGQVTSLPYVVPVGKQVCIKGYGIEGYDSSGISVIFMWTGNPNPVTSQWRIEHALPSAAAKGGSQEISSMNFCFGEGEYLNVRLINGSSYSGVYGWHVTGEITDVQ